MSARSFDITKINRKQSNIKVSLSDSGTLYVLLHGHVVFTKTVDGIITLSSCGYRTTTIKTAINRAFNQLNLSHRSVVQRKGVWWLTNRGELSVPFSDGMELVIL
jgi:hypothetical protein